MELQGAVVMITGGGTGIGKAAAVLFAERGAKVIVCGRRPSPLTETARLIEQREGDALALLTNVRDSAQVMETVGTVLERFGKLDILVNNAGIAIAKPVLETTEGEWDETLDTNLKGVFLCCKSVLPSMVEAGSGVIVNISSILGNTGIANFGAYCASKFGVVGLTQALAEELRPERIQIYAICPGPTYTALHRGIVGEEMAKLAMSPEKVAGKVMGLVTGEIPLPSGATMVVDGQCFRLAQHDAKGKWRQAARRWLKPA